MLVVLCPENESEILGYFPLKSPSSIVCLTHTFTITSKHLSSNCSCALRYMYVIMIHHQLMGSINLQGLVRCYLILFSLYKIHKPVRKPAKSVTKSCKSFQGESPCGKVQLTCQAFSPFPWGPASLGIAHYLLPPLLCWPQKQLLVLVIMGPL